MLLASLCINPSSKVATAEEDQLMMAENENNIKLANLLGFKKETPTRARLLQMVVGAHGGALLASASADAQLVYHKLEKDFSPLTMMKELGPALQRLEVSA